MVKLRTKNQKPKAVVVSNLTAASWLAYCDAIGLVLRHDQELDQIFVTLPGMFQYAIQPDQTGQLVLRVYEAVKASVAWAGELLADPPTPMKLLVITYRFLLGIDIRFDTLGYGNLDYHRLAWAINAANYYTFGSVNLPEITRDPDEEQLLYVRLVLNQTAGDPATLNQQILAWAPVAATMMENVADLYFNNEAWTAYTKTLLGQGVVVAPRPPKTSIRV